VLIVRLRQRTGGFHGYKLYNPSYLKKENNVTIVITMDNWQNVARELIDQGYKLFKDFCPYTYIGYDENVDLLDVEFLECIDSDVEKERLIRKFANGRKVCTTYGLCHMNIYKKILLETREFKQRYMLIDLQPWNLCYRNKDIQALNNQMVWKTSDILICGVLGFNKNTPDYIPSMSRVLQMIREDCQVIRISMGAFKGFFPQHTEIKNFSEWGDKNINRFLSEGKSVDEIKEIILSEDFYSRDKFLNFFDKQLELLERSERDCDVKIADYVRELSKSKITHNSLTHSIPEVMVELSRRLLLALSIDAELPDFKDEQFLNIENSGEIVYPSVLKALGLVNKENMGRKVNAFGMTLTIEEYIEKYIDQYISMLTAMKNV
jgi:hypothetical protein